MPRIILLFCSCIAFLMLHACSHEPRVAAAGQHPDWPDRLRMAYQPSDEDVERRMEVFDEMAAYLSDEIGIPVELIRTSGYGPIIEAMRAKKIDFGQSGGSFTYMIAHEKAAAEAIITRGTPAGPGMYSSIIVTSPRTGIESMAEVKSRQSELVFAFVDPASTSGHLVPRAALESMEIDPAGFKQTIFTMNHTNSAMTVVSAKVDVGGMSKSTYDRLIERGHIASDDLVILWQSDPIPTGPVIVRRDLPDEIKRRIENAYLKLNKGGPLADELARQAGIDNLVYYKANDSMWDGLRAMAYRVDTMKLLESN